MNEAQQQRPWTWQEKMNLMLFLAEFPALSVMVFLRQRIGLRHLPLRRIFVVALPLWWLFTPFDPANFNGPHAPGCLGLFGIVFLFLGAYQHGQRWRDFKRGIKWHSYHRGVSLIRLPFLAEYNVCRFIEPVAVMALGYLVLRHLSSALGFWLLFGGMCLRLIEDHYHKLNLERHLDVLDSVVSSEVIDETVQHFEKPQGSKAVQPMDAVSTGLTDDLKELMKRRKKAHK